jgi:hypothetical protein
MPAGSICGLFQELHSLQSSSMATPLGRSELQLSSCWRGVSGLVREEPFEGLDAEALATGNAYASSGHGSFYQIKANCIESG